MAPDVAGLSAVSDSCGCWLQAWRKFFLSFLFFIVGPNGQLLTGFSKFWPFHQFSINFHLFLGLG
jgi:hypothetical protein